MKSSSTEDLEMKNPKIRLSALNASTEAGGLINTAFGQSMPNYTNIR